MNRELSKIKYNTVQISSQQQLHLPLQKNKLFLYGGVALGILLLVGTLATAKYGLSYQNKRIYELACEQQAVVDEIGFKDFYLSDYPVTYYDGNYDYVITSESGGNHGYQITKRRPVLDAFAGTAYFVQDHYEVIVPTIENMHTFFQTMESAQKLGSITNGENVTFDQSTYAEREQAATIWHEAFHAYQFTKAEKAIETLLNGYSFGENGFGESLIVREVDAKAEVCNLYKEELALLKEAVKLAELIQNGKEIGQDTKTQRDALCEIAAQYLQMDEVRRNLLSEDVKILEEYFTRIEGSAYYIEGCVYQNLYSKEAFWQKYMEDFEQYHEGSRKYYQIGMAQCRILDALTPNWKEAYLFEESFAELIASSIC